MIRILVADDHAILRAGIKALLQLHADLEIVGEAADGHEAVTRTKALSPDVVLMDIGMPGLDGLAATAAITAACPEARVLILTQHENREYVLPALKAGAAGYVLKRAPDDSLVRAIREVFAGGTYLDPRISGVLVEDVRRHDKGDVPDLYDALTERERQVLILLARGGTYSEAAEALFISVKTVEFHRANLMRKLGISKRADLTLFAVQRGLID